MRILFATLMSIFVSSTSYAISIINMKNDRVLLDLQGEPLVVGDRLGARDNSGKARALLEIKQVKGNRAIAVVTRGRMDMGYAVSPLNTGGGRSTGRSQSPAKASGKNKWGLLAGYAMSNMNVKMPTSGSSGSLSGSSFNFGGLYQMHLDGNISARIVGGFETLNVKGDTSIGSRKVDISYLGGEALVQYTFMRRESIDLWAGAGLGFLFAMSKSSDILEESKITTNQTIVGSLGIDYKLKGRAFIPIQFDYAIFPDNSSTSANQMILRFGYGWTF